MKTLHQARQYAAQVNHNCANHAFDSDFGFACHITYADKVKYVAKERQYAREIETGIHDHNFTIWQRMNYYLTGEMVALLPN